MTEGAILRKCILTQNAAKRRGGAVYMDGGGRMENCYVTRNQTTGVGLTDGQGGGVCMEVSIKTRRMTIFSPLPE